MYSSITTLIFDFTDGAVLRHWLGWMPQVQLLPAILGLAVSTVLNTCYFGRTLLRVYAKPEESAAFRSETQGRRRFLLAAGALCVGNLILGLHAQPLLELLERGLALLQLP